jgi:hypothetical protein
VLAAWRIMRTRGGGRSIGQPRTSYIGQSQRPRLRIEIRTPAWTCQTPTMHVFAT